MALLASPDPGSLRETRQVARSNATHRQPPVPRSLLSQPAQRDPHSLPGPVRPWEALDGGQALLRSESAGQATPSRCRFRVLMSHSALRCPSPVLWDMFHGSAAPSHHSICWCSLDRDLLPHRHRDRQVRAPGGGAPLPLPEDRRSRPVQDGRPAGRARAQGRRLGITPEGEAVLRALAELERAICPEPDPTDTRSRARRRQTTTRSVPQSPAPG
jgi:hypothetical protein